MMIFARPLDLQLPIMMQMLPSAIHQLVNSSPTSFSVAEQSLGDLRLKGTDPVKIATSLPDDHATNTGYKGKFAPIVMLTAHK